MLLRSPHGFVEWDGAAWIERPLEGLGGSAIVAPSASEAYSVGRGRIARFDGERWTEHDAGTWVELRSIAIAGDDLLAAGQGGTIVRFHDGAWSREDTTTTTTLDTTTPSSTLDTTTTTKTLDSTTTSSKLYTSSTSTTMYTTTTSSTLDTTTSSSTLYTTTTSSTLDTTTTCAIRDRATNFGSFCMSSASGGCAI